MDDLLNDYKRRLKTIMLEIRKGGNDLTLNRLGTKASCYRTIIAELERNQSRLPTVGEVDIVKILSEKLSVIHPKQAKKPSIVGFGYAAAAIRSLMERSEG